MGCSIEQPISAFQLWALSLQSAAFSIQLSSVAQPARNALNTSVERQVFTLTKLVGRVYHARSGGELTAEGGGPKAEKPWLKAKSWKQKSLNSKC